MASNIDGATININELALTGGRFQTKGWSFAITANATAQTKTISLPFDADALSVSAFCDGVEHGDKLSVDIAPDSTVGLVDNVGGYASGAKVITVDQTVVDNMDIGFIVKFGSDTVAYWVTAFDTSAKTITIWPKDGNDDGLTNAINDDDAVKRTVCMVDGEFMSTQESVHAGVTKIGGSGVPASTDVVFTFTNSSATAKTLYFNVDFLYGKPSA